MSSFAERFKYLRESKSWTQEEIAEILGISRATVAGYESTSKARVPRDTILRTIADLFEVSIDYLLGRVDNPELELSEGGQLAFGGLNTDPVQVSRRLKWLREISGITPQQVAQELSIPTAIYKQYEEGTAQPDMEIIRRIAHTYHLDHETLLNAHFGFYSSRLMALRNAREFSEDDVAKALGIPVQQYIAYEDGSEHPSTAIMLRLCTLLKTWPQYLMGLSFESQPHDERFLTRLDRIVSKSEIEFVNRIKLLVGDDFFEEWGQLPRSRQMEVIRGVRVVWEMERTRRVH